MTLLNLEQYQGCPHTNVMNHQVPILHSIRPRNHKIILNFVKCDHYEVMVSIKRFGFAILRALHKSDSSLSLSGDNSLTRSSVNSPDLLGHILSRFVISLLFRQEGRFYQFCVFHVEKHERPTSVS